MSAAKANEESPRVKRCEPGYGAQVGFKTGGVILVVTSSQRRGQAKRGTIRDSAPTNAGGMEGPVARALGGQVRAVHTQARR